MESLKDVFSKLGIPTVDREKETEEERKERLKKLCEMKCKYFNESIGNLDPAEYNCSKCNNRGGYMKPKEREDGECVEVFVPCKCMKVRKIIQKLNRSGLRDIVHKYTFDNFKATEEWQKTVKDTAQRFIADEENKWFFFGGQSGAGKTAICTAITVHYLKKDMETRYMLWRDDITKIKAAVTDAEAYQRMIDDLKTVSVLYIDDLFKSGAKAGETQHPTPADINVAYEIINYRYNNPELITIISSEFMIRDILEVDEALGGRIAEKTADAGYCINIKKDAAKNYRTKGLFEL